MTDHPSIRPDEVRVGDWVRWTRHAGDGGTEQIVTDGSLSYHLQQSSTRIEPPVGWPVGVPDGDGGTRWYVKDSGDYYNHVANEYRRLTWADLVAAGGVPALAPMEA